MFRTPGAVATAAVLLVAACSGPPEAPEAPAEVADTDSGWTVVAVEDLDDAQKAQQQHGLDAIQALGGRLMGELTTALDEGGPNAAIEVCSLRAPEIAAAVSNEYGLFLGRTSHRLRNQSNVPPVWAEPLVRDMVTEPTWLVGPDGQVAGMLPITLKTECGMCHGPRDQIADDVLARLDDFYPDDAAVDFVEGDLRGWIWVEAPPS